MFLLNAGGITLFDSTISDCSAGYTGGGVRLYQSSGGITLYDSSILRCVAGTSGGGISSEENRGEIELIRSRFFNNTAYATASVLLLRHLSSAGASSVRDTAFAGNLPGEVETISATSELVWQDCPLGRWMGATGAFFGDILPGGCSSLCAAGTFGNETNLTDATCSAACPLGHYCEEGTAVPVPCPSGTRNPVLGAQREDACIPCAPGAHQPSNGSTTCIPCRAGTYSPLIGQASCISCPAGGFCEADGAATIGIWQPCPAGSYNAESGASSSESCLSCPSGTSNTVPGANSSAKCSPCEEGTYAARPEGECIPCPHPLGSAAMSTECSICIDGFYLKDPSTSPSVVHASPSMHCTECTGGVVCAANTTLASLGVPPGYWRASAFTEQIYKCDDPNTCSPDHGVPSGRRRRSLAATNTDETGEYCSEGHTGPLCKVCVDKDEYLVDGRCKECPRTVTRLGIVTGSVFGAVLLAALCFVATLRDRWCRDIATACKGRLKHLGYRTGVLPMTEVQAKLKTLISFYQICSVLPTVYGVELHSDFTGWFRWMDKVNLNLLDLIYPGTCLGSMRDRMIINALWPYLLIVALTVGIAAHALMACTLAVEDTSSATPRESWRTDRPRVLRVVLHRSIFTTVLVLYLVLPGVSRAIFQAKECDSYSYDDSSGQAISYLVADLRLACNQG